MNFMSLLQAISITIIPLLFAITLHEAAHGYVANKLGDKTALILGRVSLNPVKHIDLIGTIVIPLASLLFTGVFFGWAKPVPITWQNFKHPRRDIPLVALAGPMSNLLMAFLWGLLIKILFLIELNLFSINSNILQFFYFTGSIGVRLNCVFAILNLLPIPPLDGSRIMASLLPRHLAYHYEKIEIYGLFIVLGLLFLGLFNYVILPIAFLLMNWIEFILQIRLAI